MAEEPQSDSFPITTNSVHSINETTTEVSNATVSPRKKKRRRRCNCKPKLNGQLKASSEGKDVANNEEHADDAGVSSASPSITSDYNSPGILLNKVCRPFQLIIRRKIHSSTDAMKAYEISNTNLLPSEVDKVTFKYIQRKRSYFCCKRLGLSTNFLREQIFILPLKRLIIHSNYAENDFHTTS